MIEQPQRDKMMRNPAVRKEYHFAATAEHLAEVVYADTIREAEQIYHRVKRLISPPAAQSTPEPEKEPSESEVQ